jgi:hypothetical protein
LGQCLPMEPRLAWTDSPTSASWVLELQICTTMPGSMFILYS